MSFLLFLELGLAMLFLVPAFRLTTVMGLKMLGKYTCTNNPLPSQMTSSRQTDFLETMQEASQNFGTDS